MQHLFLTNTTYGTWLPGDRRGSVTSTRERRPISREASVQARVEHDQPGEPWQPGTQALYLSAQQLMKGPAIYLTQLHAEVTLQQFRETAAYRCWDLIAVSIMSNHYHILLKAPAEASADRALSDLKAYASRALNAKFGRPASGTWWTMNGSKRRCRDERAIEARWNYILFKQSHPLVVWSKEHGRLL